MGQDVRAIDWRRDCTETVLRKIRAGEGHPGVLDEIGGVEFFLFGAHPERLLTGRPREVIASREQAICRATRDGAVWITHLKRADTDAERFFKLPAARALALAGIELAVPEVAVALTERLSSEDTFREISYHERAGVGYLGFEFYNGAMSTDHCIRLRKTLAYARSRPTRVIVLTGGADYFSNGIHLNVIEAADDPGVESWRNLNAIDDLVRDIIETDSHIVISALRGDAAAGGVPLALAADVVIANEDVVLNPYYQHMGGLYGSEYWTYLLPGRVGREMTARLTGAPFTPIGAQEALRIGLLDEVFGADVDVFESGARSLAEGLAARTEPCSSPRAQARPPCTRRANQADRGLPLRRARTVARLLLRRPLRLSRGAQTIRPQAVRSRGRSGACGRAPCPPVRAPSPRRKSCLAHVAGEHVRARSGCGFEDLS